MVWLIEEGGGISAPEAAAYAAAVAIDPGSRTAQEQAVVDDVAAKYAEPLPAAVDLLTFASTLQADVNKVSRQYAGPGRETAMTEMLSVLVARQVEMYTLILDLRTRVVGLGG